MIATPAQTHDNHELLLVERETLVGAANLDRCQILEPIPPSMTCILTGSHRSFTPRLVLVFSRAEAEISLHGLSCYSHGQLPKFQSMACPSILMGSGQNFTPWLVFLFSFAAAKNFTPWLVLVFCRAAGQQGSRAAAGISLVTSLVWAFFRAAAENSHGPRESVVGIDRKLMTGKRTIGQQLPVAGNQ